jgi:hypothetical protein
MVVNKCDLVCEYLGMEGNVKSITYLMSDLSQEEVDKRLKKIVECLGLEENGGCYIGSNPFQKL